MTELTESQFLAILPEILRQHQLTPTEQKLPFSAWHLTPQTKIVMPCDQLRDGRKVPVRLKIRVPNSVTSRETFIAFEQAAREVNEQLFKAGLPAQRTIEANFDQPPEWIIREEIEGSPIGNRSFDPAVSDEEIMAFLERLRTSLDQIAPRVNRQLLSTYNWQTKWLDQFNEAGSNILAHLGEKTFELVKEKLSQPITTQLTNSLVHTDLSPINILRGQAGLFPIDWNEALWGPRAIDWMTIWSFAYDRPDLSELILTAMLKEPHDPNERQETIKVAEATAARMLYKFAESYDYHLKSPGERKGNIEEAIQALPLATSRFTTLLQRLG